MSHNQFSQFLNVAVCQSKCRLSRSYIQCHTTKADLILVALSGCFHLWVTCARRILLNRIWIPPRGVKCKQTADKNFFYYKTYLSPVQILPNDYMRIWELFHSKLYFHPQVSQFHQTKVSGKKYTNSYQNFLLVCKQF